MALGLHYIVTADASAWSKSIIGGLLVAVMLFGRWMPVFLSLSIQILVSAYILLVYRIQEPLPGEASARRGSSRQKL